jgi:hypothetical protein
MRPGRPVLDDEVGPAFELTVAWSFDPDGVATWYAQRGDVVYRVTADP